MRKLFYASVALLLATLSAFGQATQVQQVGTRLDAGTNIAIGTGFNTVATATTATATAPAGQYIYITNIVLDICGDGTANGAVLSNTTFTTTGIAGGPTWEYSQPVTGSASCTHWGDGPFPVPLKSASPGTNVTVAAAGTPTHTAWAFKLYYYTAP